jgi:LPS sulfotransferase NodH
LLTATNVAGRPEEFFFQAVELIYREQWQVSSYADYIHRAFIHGTTPNSVFGAKVDTGDYLSYFEKQLRAIPEFSDPALPLYSILISLFPNLKFIWLTRRDKIRQAVSWWKASQSKEWACHTVAPCGAKQDLQYQFTSIDRLVAESVMREAAWQAYYSEWGVIPLTLVYEDYVENYRGSVAKVLDFLEIDDAYIFREEAITLLKQADALSEEWVQRYHEEKQQGWGNKGW